MFGRTIVPLGEAPPPRPFPKDRAAWGSRPGEWAVIARRTGSDWPSRSMQANQKRSAANITHQGKIAKDLSYLAMRNDWNEALERRNVVSRIKEKVEMGLKCYEEFQNERRERIRDLYTMEQRMYEKEVLERTKHIQETRFEGLRQKAEALLHEQEAERKAIVEEKRLQQYRNRCEDLRPLQASVNLRASKEAQLYQIKEKELKEAQEREIDKMWRAISLKEDEALRRREIQDARDRFSKDKANIDVLQMQIAGVRAQEASRKAIVDEERIRAAEIAEEMRLEKINVLNDKIKKRDNAAKELTEQIATREAFLAQRKKEEDAIDNTFTRLAQAELERERGAVVDNASRFKREIIMYRENLEQMRKEREIENRELDRLVDEEQRIAEEQRDARRLIIRQAREKLLAETISGRNQQLEEQKQRQLEDAKKKMAEQELADRMRTLNNQLDESTKRERWRQQEQYKQDLLDQIEYTNLLRKREQEELDRQFANGQMEEEKYLRLVKELLANPKLLTPHPFSLAIFRDGSSGPDMHAPKCPCPAEFNKSPI